MSMGNFRNELKNYQVISRELIFDSSLSDRARFVYCFMAAKPDGWNFYIETMSKEIGYHPDTLRKYINELISGGWLLKGGQSNNGKFGAVEYTLLSSKDKHEISDTEISDTEKFGDGEIPSHIEKRDIQEKREIREIKENTKKKSSFDVRLDLSYVSEEMMPIWNEWLDYKDEIKKPYKTQRGAKMQYNSFIKYSENNPELANAIIKRSIEQSWDGLFALTDKQKEFFLSDKSPYRVEIEPKSKIDEYYK